MSNKEVSDLRKRAKRTLLKTMSCALTQVRVVQDEYELYDEEILRALGGLSGGVLTKGSTCGGVMSTALSLALIKDSKISEWSIKDEIELHALIGRFMKRFQQEGGIPLCRNNSHIDFWTEGAGGLFKPKNTFSCLSNVGKSMEQLSQIINSDVGISIDNIDSSQSGFHCARAVLEKVKKQTSVGNQTLENISIALDGGIGLQGQACGAICGAIMAMGLHSGDNYMEHGMLKNTMSLLKSVKAIRKNKNTKKFPLFTEGKKVIEEFLKEANSMECQDITSRSFENWSDFQKYGHSSDKCNKLIDLCAERAIEFIQKSEI